MPNRPRSPRQQKKKERPLDEALEMTFPASDPVAVTYDDDPPPRHRPSQRPEEPSPPPRPRPPERRRRTR